MLFGVPDEITDMTGSVPGTYRVTGRGSGHPRKMIWALWAKRGNTPATMGLVRPPPKWVGCHGNESDSKSRGYVEGGNVLATARLYTHFYEFRPLSEEVIALRLSATEACRLDMCESYRGYEPSCQRRGVAYIECARSLQPSVTQGSM
jgi:hypothetical protein